MTEYGVRGVVPGRVGCVLGGVIVLAAAFVGQLVGGAVGALIMGFASLFGARPDVSAGVTSAAVSVVVTVVGSWWSIRHVARRRDRVVYVCARCGVLTDPRFDVCRSCGRLKSPG